MDLNKYNKNVLTIAFSVFSFASIISLLESYYEIWYLKNIEFYLIISFGVLTIYTLLISLKDNKEKLITMYYLIILSFAQYIVQLTKKSNFYALEKESVWKTIFNNTYENFQISSFLLISIALLILIIYSEKNERKEKKGLSRLQSDDIKKLSSILVISVILSLFTDIQKGINEINKTKIEYHINKETK